MDGKTVTETKIGNTTYIVTGECSSTATETIAEKLERLILRRFSDTVSYQTNPEIQLAMCENKSEHGQYK